MTTIQDSIAQLRAEAGTIESDLQTIALGIVADMEFTLSEGWPEGLPDENSRVTQRERHTYGSAANCVRLIKREADRIDALEKALREKDEAVQTELCRVCNAYAKEGNMAGATAIDDAARCVAALGEGE